MTYGPKPQEVAVRLQEDLGNLYNVSTRTIRYTVSNKRHVI